MMLKSTRAQGGWSALVYLLCHIWDQYFLGAHPLPTTTILLSSNFLLLLLLMLVTDRSTTHGDAENLITSLYRSLVSVVSERKVGGSFNFILGEPSESVSSSSLSVSESPVGSNGGVGIHDNKDGARSSGVPASHVIGLDL